MSTLRDQLIARRNAYLERIAVFDDMEYPEPVDLRVAQCRRFLEGGDDIPPECEEKGTKRERRRIDSSLLLDPEKAAAAARLNGPKGCTKRPGEPSAEHQARWGSMVK